jgi:hypothetical protein
MATSLSSTSGTPKSGTGLRKDAVAMEDARLHPWAAHVLHKRERMRPRAPDFGPYRAPDNRDAETTVKPSAIRHYAHK